MKNTYVPGFWLALLLGVSSSLCGAADLATTLVVTATDDGWKLSVPVSKVQLSIPRGGLAATAGPETGANGPRYFKLEDPKQGLIVSGWFESAAAWKGFEPFVAGELQGMKKAGIVLQQPPRPVVASPWQAFAYDVELPGGHNVNVRAEAITAGTWIDLHISVTGRAPPSELQGQIIQLLQSMVISDKP